MDNQKVLGNTASVVFPSLQGKQLQGKVDTGATTSSLHAQDIQVSKSIGQKHVMFRCPQLSNNMIQAPFVGSQEVHSADGGGQSRPIISLDVEINGVPIRDVEFNLNDRSNMDAPILIGQNALQAGGFVIDPSQGEKVEQQSEPAQVEQRSSGVQRESAIISAIEVLAENDVTLSEIITYLQTAAVNRIKE